MALQVADSKADIYTWRSVNYLQSKSRGLGFTGSVTFTTASVAPCYGGSNQW